MNFMEVQLKILTFFGEIDNLGLNHTKMKRTPKNEDNFEEQS